MRNVHLLLVLLLLSSTAFSQPATRADSGVWLPAYRARLVALDLLELDSLRAERQLLAIRLQLFEQYRTQAAKRSAADSLALQAKDRQLAAHQNQLVIAADIQRHYQYQADRYKCQRNIAIFTATVVTTILARQLLRTGPAP
jgi:hypothetical protein